MSDVQDHYNAIAGGYHRQYQPGQLHGEGPYPANQFRLQILLARLKALGAASVYEIGVGEGTPLASMAALGLKVAGCDIAHNMVQIARETFTRHGLDPSVIHWGDVAQPDGLLAPLGEQRFDAVVAAGVLPHVARDEDMLAGARALVRPGGSVFIEFRNKLFSLFTFNRYTRAFILDDLLACVPDAIKQAVAADLDKRLALDQPPVRAVTAGGAPGYDAIPARFHNPLQLPALFEREGFLNPRLHWYHYHPAPPFLEKTIGPAFREAAAALEHRDDWRGLFLCSAGVVEARRGE